MKTIIIGTGFLIFFLSSCRRDIQNRPPAIAGSDSISLLTATGHGGFLYTGDTLPDRLFSINGTDTTYIYYNAQKNVVRLMSIFKLSNLYPRFQKSYQFAVYDQGKIVKMYGKRPVWEHEPEYNDPGYGLTIGPVNSQNIMSYDSLVYDNTNKLIANYHFRSPQTSAGAPFKLDCYEILDYHNPYTSIDSFLYAVYLYQDWATPGNYTIADKIFFKKLESGKINPLYKTCKELALFKYINHITRFFLYGCTVSVDDRVARYTTLLPYPIKQVNVKVSDLGGTHWEDYDFQNTFDPDGNLLSSYNSSVCTGYSLFGYNYIRVRK